jgi:hypothetical protein
MGFTKATMAKRTWKNSMTWILYRRSLTAMAVDVTVGR